MIVKTFLGVAALALLAACETAEPTPYLTGEATPTPTWSAANSALARAAHMNGDYSGYTWGAPDCEQLSIARGLGYVYAYASGGTVRLTDFRERIPAGAPFTDLDSEWLRHCAIAVVK